MRRVATKDEMQEQDYIAQAIKIMNKKHPKKVDAKETIKCPKCGCDLIMLKSSYNGHIWGFCSNPKGCLNWMM